jgi:uncharacterized YigZ family protein
MNDSGIYSTISKPSKGVYKEKGSKFFSFAFPISGLDQSAEILEKLRKEHHAAKHHCYAYNIIGPGSNLIRANDDGEPANTAGKPILGQIGSFGVVNVMVIVVRYFGGTLLGKGGLIQAYKNAAADALSHASIIQVIPKDIFEVTTDYKNINEIMRIIGNDESEIISSNWGDNAVIKFKTPISKSAEIIQKFKRIEGVKIESLGKA